MKNITFSADEQLIDQARRRAVRQGNTLNEEFRRWLADYVRQEERLGRFDQSPGDCEARSGSGASWTGRR